MNDGVILVSLKEGHAPTADYVRRLREVLPAAFPTVTFYFQAADMTTQILNFGLPAQIDVRVVGRDRTTNLHLAHELRRRIALIPGIADAHLQQELDAPAFMAHIDRSRALQLGLNAQTIATDLNTSLSSSEQVFPNFWTDPTNGIPYYIAVQTPEHSGELAQRTRQHSGVDRDFRERHADTGIVEQHRDDATRERSDQSESDQYCAGVRRLRQRARPRSRQHFE